MKSLFDPDTIKEITSRINNLKPDSQAQWGNMNVAQMVTHAQAPFKVAFEELKIKRGLIGILFGGIAKKQLTSEEPFKKNLPTEKNFLVKGNPDFNMEKQNLINYVHKFGQSKGKLTNDQHPFFGKLTEKEWDILIWKHLDHHLRQFGT